MDLFALATLPAAADEAGEPPPTKFYELRDNLRRSVGPLLLVGRVCFAAGRWGGGVAVYRGSLVAVVWLVVEGLAWVTVVVQAILSVLPPLGVLFDRVCDVGFSAGLLSSTA